MPLAAKLDQHDEAVTAALADILRKQPWAHRFPAAELAKFLLAAREGVLARTVRDDGSAPTWCGRLPPWSGRRSTH